jgi:hypothetical protein
MRNIIGISEFTAEETFAPERVELGVFVYCGLCRWRYEMTNFTKTIWSNFDKLSLTNTLCHCRAEHD